jgi:ERCC4-type nuclease
MFYLDTRENDLIGIVSAKEDQKTDMVVKQLPVGDIWIGIEGEGEEAKMQEGGLIIERKSIRDLEASILDGRYREQRGRILAYCQENKTRPMYILEGSYLSSSGRLQKKALMKFINRLIFHYQIPVMQTATIYETAELVQALVEQYKETDPSKNLQVKTSEVKVTDGIHIQKKANAADPKLFAICCLAQCPGVSVKMAEAILEEYHTLQGVLQAEAKQMEQIKVGTRKVGPVVSKRLYDMLHAESS